MLLRSLLYKGLFYGLTFLWVLCLLPTLLWPNYKLALRGLSFWGDVNIWLIKHIVGIEVVIKGEEYLPEKGPYIVSPKHESTLDALLAFRFVPDATALGKSELFKVPILGTVLRKMELIPVDRWVGTAHKDLPDVETVIRRSGRPILVFPEGTRVPQGEVRKLKPGAFHLQDGNEFKVFPVATNAGSFWGARGVRMHSGTVVWEIQPALPKNLDKDAFMAELEKKVVDRSVELKKEFPPTN